MLIALIDLDVLILKSYRHTWGNDERGEGKRTRKGPHHLYFPSLAVRDLGQTLPHGLGKANDLGMNTQRHLLPFYVLCKAEDYEQTPLFPFFLPHFMTRADSTLGPPGKHCWFVATSAAASTAAASLQLRSARIHKQRKWPQLCQNKIHISQMPPFLAKLRNNELSLETFLQLILCATTEDDLFNSSVIGPDLADGA